MTSLIYCRLNYWSFELLHVEQRVVVQTTNSSNDNILCAFKLFFLLIWTLKKVQLSRKIYSLNEQTKKLNISQKIVQMSTKKFKWVKKYILFAHLNFFACLNYFFAHLKYFFDHLNYLSVHMNHFWFIELFFCSFENYVLVNLNLIVILIWTIKCFICYNLVIWISPCLKYCLIL